MLRRRINPGKEDRECGDGDGVALYSEVEEDFSDKATLGLEGRKGASYVDMFGKRIAGRRNRGCRLAGGSL